MLPWDSGELMKPQRFLNDKEHFQSSFAPWESFSPLGHSVGGSGDISSLSAFESLTVTVTPVQ